MSTEGDKANEQDAEREHSPVPLRILLAEDDQDLRVMLGMLLRQEGHQVLEAHDGPHLRATVDASLNQAGPRAVDLVISDQHMPGCTGLDVLAGLRRVNGRTPFILITALGDAAIHAEATRLGAAVLDKPFDLVDLRQKIAEVTEAHSY